jgi:hypothetical protein
MGSLSGSGRRASRRWTAIAGVSMFVAATIFAQRGEVAFDTASPPLVTQVPSRIPAGGVNVNDQVTLMPPVGRATLLKSSNEAIYAARKFGNPKLPQTTLLCTFTDPGSIPPPDSPVPFLTIQDRLAWVITFTSPKPVDVEVGVAAPEAGATAVPAGLYATHFNVVLDANTGKFLRGFFTA